ncbi:MAG: hypothetical protein ABIA76_05425 [Candidatus Diapherotrites archaeon]
MKSFDAINPAIEATKQLLFPFDLTRWLKLGVVALLSGNSAGGGNFPSSGGSTGNSTELPFFDFNAFIAQYGLIIGTIAFVLLIICIILTYIASVFSFVFLENLIERKDAVISAFGRNSGKGFSYFLFHIVLGLATIITLILFIAPAFLFLSGGNNIGLILAIIGLLLLWFFTFGLLFGIITGFTYGFVLPLMHLKNKGLKESWKELKNMVFKEKKEFLMYIIMSIILGIGAGLIALVLLIPLLIIAFIIGIIALIAGAAALFTGGFNLTIILIIIAIAVPALIIFSYLAAVSTLPVTVFLRYYSIIFIGKMDSETGKLLEAKGIKLN